jgi:hypothetical protein
VVVVAVAVVGTIAWRVLGIRPYLFWADWKKFYEEDHESVKKLGAERSANLATINYLRDDLQRERTLNGKLAKEVGDLNSLRADLSVECARLKRSNAALRGRLKTRK